MSEGESPEIPFEHSTFMQQQLRAWRPFLTPIGTAIIYGCLALITLLFAILLSMSSSSTWEQEIRYDDPARLDHVHSVTLHIPKDLDATLYVYYKLTNFYQNNFMYGSSKSWLQFEGEHPDPDDLSSCEPLLKSNGMILSPCGALPTSLFNDSFEFPALFGITSEGIAIPSFAKYFKSTNTEYSDNESWIDETAFPDGQIHERFINWAHLAAFPSFRKLWGKTPGPVKVPMGDYEIVINDRYPVASFEGSKSIVVAEANWAGGKNGFLGTFFFVLFGISTALAILFLALHLTNALPLYKALKAEDER
jgi:hypothetical protein